MCLMDCRASKMDARNNMRNCITMDLRYQVPAPLGMAGKRRMATGEPSPAWQGMT